MIRRATPRRRARSDPLAAHPRYIAPWRAPFDAYVLGALGPGGAVLDVGSGRYPAVPLEARPEGVRYVGLDLSAAQLSLAPVGSYDEEVVTDIAAHDHALDGRFDLVVSWQVLEHVRPMRTVLENVRSYLRPRGVFVAQLSGANSAFAIGNRLLPSGVGRWALRTLLDRDPATVFPAYYDSCTYSELACLLASWSETRIVPRYRGASYLGFVPPLQRLYVRAEDSMERGRHRDLATHYLVRAVR